MNEKNDRSLEVIRNTVMAARESAKAVDDFIAVINRVQQSSEAWTPDESTDIVLDALARISEIVTNMPQLALGVIRNHLLPRCTRVEGVNDDSSPAILRGY